MARTANVSPPSLPAVSATQMLQTRTPSAHLMRGGNQDEGMEEKDEEDKKKIDLTEKVTLELTARSIIASCGLRRACTGTRWVDGKP